MHFLRKATGLSSSTCWIHSANLFTVNGALSSWFKEFVRFFIGFSVQDEIDIVKTGVSKHWAATRCLYVKKLLPGRAESKPNWSKSDWNDWQKEHTASAIDYYNSYRSEHLLRQSNPRSLPESVPWWTTSCNKFACAKYSLFYWGSVRKIFAMLTDELQKMHVSNIHYYIEGRSAKKLSWWLTWLTSCNKFACAKYSLFYWGPVRKIMPGWNRSAVQKTLAIPAVNGPVCAHVFSICFAEMHECSRPQAFFAEANSTDAPGAWLHCRRALESYLRPIDNIAAADKLDVLINLLYSLRISMFANVPPAMKRLPGWKMSTFSTSRLSMLVC